MAEIKDIIFRGEVDLTNCASEPIHIPGSIQPHGFLLGLDKDYNVTYCSQNINTYLDMQPQDVLGKNIHEFTSEDEFNRLKSYIETFDKDQSPAFVFHYKNEEFNMLLHQSGETIVLEIEPFPDGSMPLPNLYAQMRNFVSFMEESYDLQELCNYIAVETRKITGYDRVMIYRFDNEYNGEVFAEAKRDDIEPYLGLNYPHTDIPVQARELYLRNLMRLIADVNYVPVPVLTLADANEDKTLDMSLSTLRSVSPIHIEYLKNMGVSGTLTISLIKDAKLWGLITCHHYSPLVIPHYTRLAAKLQGYFLTSQIAVRETAEEFRLSVKIDNHLDELMRIVSEEDDFIKKLLSNDSILKVANADGVLIVNNGVYHTLGNVPARENIDKLLNWLGENVSRQYFYSYALSEHFEEAASFSENASGIIYHSLGRSPKNSMIWFRTEKEKTINWAGDPSKAMIKVMDPQGHRLSPRKSFELWKQSVKFQSQEWRRPEVNAAIRLATNVENQLYLLNLKREEEKYRKLSERLQSANEQLESFNWISSHDLKEPLRMISIYSQALAGQFVESNDEFLRNASYHITEGVSRINNLINALLEYNRVGTVKASYNTFELKDVFDEISNIFGPELQNNGGELLIKNIPDKLVGVKVLIQQLFTNLIQNAIKFRSPQRPLQIVIDAEKTDDYWQFTVSDNGIGIQDEYAEKIFKVFQRLHTHEEFSGSGMGLAICKRIVDLHQGQIWLKGELNVGSTFYITLPVEPVIPL